jgi:hypothetical protein
MLAWIGIALLSASWLFGVAYYYPPEPTVWFWLVVVGTSLLTTVPLRLPANRAAAGVLLLTSLAFWGFWQPAQRAAIMLLLIGSASCLLPPALGWIARRRLGIGPSPVVWHSTVLERLATGTILAGCVLLLQSLGLEIYDAFTSRSHELPAALLPLLGAVANLFGIDTGVNGSTVSLFSMREIHMLGGTWELLLDPVTFSFIVGGAAALAWRLWSDGLRKGTRLRQIGQLGAFIGLVALWLPVRSGLLMALFLHGVLRTEYDDPLNSVHWFWSAWLHLFLLGVPVLAAWRFCSLRPREGGAPPAAAAPSGRTTHLWRHALAGALVFAAAGAMTVAVLWDPVGARKEGRVVFEEYNPEPDKVWERTDKPFDTHWYGHKSGYTYYCIYDYLGRYYDTSRLTQPIDDGSLGKCDVLVLKTPTRPFYSTGEIASIRRFVERGGGLLLIGEHTDVYGTGERLNAVARQFGFRFVSDSLFGMGFRQTSVFEQELNPPPTAHPVLQYVRAVNARDVARMDFATSCSLDVQNGAGRAVIRSTGLKSKTAEYHVENYYPPPSDTAKMRYGAFVQLWSTGCGRGRVLAFTDSTDFSNFCTFDRGKSELMLGMIEWLNHSPLPWDPRPWLTGLAVLLAVGGISSTWNRSETWLVLLAAGLLGYAAAACAVAAENRVAMPLPNPKPDRRLVRVAMDRSVAAARLPINGFMDGRPHGFGVFERCVLRLGYFTVRRDAPETFASDVDLLVIAYPRQPVSQRYREQLAAYVKRGGKLLVIDSSRNDAAAMEEEKKRTKEASRQAAIAAGRSPAEAQEEEEHQDRDHCDEPPSEALVEHSTANALLEPFQMSVARDAELRGMLKTAQELAPVPVSSAVEVGGGQPFAWIDGRPVGAWRTFGSGTVVVVGYGDRFCDQQMGITGDVEPDADMTKVYDQHYALLRAIIAGQPLGGNPSHKDTTRKH